MCSIFQQCFYLNIYLYKYVKKNFFLLVRLKFKPMVMVTNITQLIQNYELIIDVFHSKCNLI